MLNRFKKDDWVSIGGSLILHLVFILVMSIMMGAATEEAAVGFIEVDFGPFAEGRPVVSARPQPVDPTPEPVEADPEEQEQPAVAPPEEVRPVDLPDQLAEIEDTEIIEEPEADTIAPDESQTEETIVDEIPQPEQETIQPLGSGTLTDEVGDQAGDEGSSNEAERATT